MSETDRQFYVGRTLEQLEDAKLEMETLRADIVAAFVSQVKRYENGRVAQHEVIDELMISAADEADAAIALIDDVIESGHSADSEAEAADKNRLAAATREKQI